MNTVIVLFLLVAVVPATGEHDDGLNLYFKVKRSTFNEYLEYCHKVFVYV